MYRTFLSTAALWPSVVLAADAPTHTMTGTEFIASTIEHLAWPGIVLLLIYLIRPHLKALIDRVLEFSFGGATVKFGEFLTTGTQIVDDAPKSGLVHPKQHGAFVDPANAALRIAEDDPHDLDGGRRPLTASAQSVQSIFYSFASVEELLEQIGERLNTKARNGRLVRMLVQRELVSEDCIDLYTNLRLARNAVAHGQSAMPNEAESLEYRRQAAYMDAILRTVVQKLEQDKKGPAAEGSATGLP